MKNKTRNIILLVIFLLAVFLRFFKLGENPASMYWDEVAIAMDAYSFNETGRDMNNMSFFQPVFGSYGDFKAPVFIWIATIFVKLFGMNAFAIRLPIAIFSLGSLILSYFLVKELLSFDRKLENKYKYLPILSFFVLAISPWPVHFARIGLESSLSVFFFLAALLLFIRGVRYKKICILLSIIPAILAVYSYYSLRVIIPLFVFLLIVIFFKKIWPKKAAVTIISIFLFLLSIIPIFQSPYYQRSQDYRLNNNNLIHHKQVIEESSKYLERYDSNLFSRLVYHRYVLLTRDFLSNFSSHFTLDFLFVNGDSNLRQHSGYLGEFFLVLMPFYLLGLFLLFKNIKSKISLFFLVFLALAPIPAAMVYEVPHASRAIYLFIPFSVIIAWGLNEFIIFTETIKNKILAILLKLLVLGAILVNASFYYADYFIEYPKRSSEAWLYQYNQVSAYIKDHYQEYRKIDIDGRYWSPELFVFYQFPELVVENQELKNALLNSPVNSFGMPNPFDYLLDEKDLSKKEAKFLYYELETPEGFYEIQDFDFLNGDKSLKLVVKDGEIIND
jgi:4-amino-4-deoxy-L-arabinose transferase-like glycosyltransferase